MSSEINHTVSTYLRDRKTLIFDPNPASRTTIRKLLVQFGMKYENISTVSTFAEAMRLIPQCKPNLIFAEHTPDNNAWRKLIEAQREQIPTPQDRIFYVVGLPSLVTVQELIQADGDGVIVRPFAMNVIEGILLRSASKKGKKIELQRKMETGQELLRSGNAKEALRVFAEIEPDHPSPHEVAYYQGLSYLSLARHTQAKG